MKHILLLTFVALASFLSTVSCATGKLTIENIDEVLRSHELVLLNFYVDWCQHSRNFAPIFDSAANKSNNQFSGRVAFGKIDGEQEMKLFDKFKVKKIPTIKVVRNGQVGKEYRGQRSVGEILKFIDDELADSVNVVKDSNELINLDTTKRHIIGLFEENNSVDFENFKKVADTQKENCIFKAGFGKTVHGLNSFGANPISFIPGKAISSQREESFTGNLKDFEELNKWVKEKCEPLLLEMSYKNVEEIVEKNTPLLMLLHKPEDFESIRKFYEITQNELFEDKGKVLFVTIDFDLFAHGLRHIGKDMKDLPAFAIDSFEHLYFFPGDEDPFEEGMLKGFLEKFYSGKLHLELHNGNVSKIQKKLRKPLKSAFQKLAPSKIRYNFLQRDEL